MARTKRSKATRPARATEKPRRWSRRVTERSDALDLEGGVFKLAPREMARSLKRSADRSTRKKSSPFRSAMPMLTFYENRAGANLPASRKQAIRRAKEELRKLYGQEPGRRRGASSRADTTSSRGRNALTSRPAPRR